jgi:D-glycero-alpha-D-manno-heptose-7-phosphate kinase
MTLQNIKSINRDVEQWKDCNHRPFIVSAKSQIESEVKSFRKVREKMIITRTPFRISFFGGGTDFPSWYKEHGGAVLSTTIDKYCYVSLRKLPPFFDFKHKIVFFSKQEAFNEFDEIQHPAVREVYRFMNVDSGLVMQHDADLPSHSGLGSSSAFTVGLLHALYSHRGEIVTKKRLGLEAVHVEQNMIHEAVGSQDQIATAFGGLNRIAFSRSDNIEVTPLAISGEKQRYLQERLMLFFTGFARFAVEIERDKINNLNSRRKELRLLHSLVDEAVDVLNGNIKGYDAFGHLLHETWLLKRSLSSKVSSSNIDEIYSRGIEAGALGGKILGAGGGGFIIFYVKPEDQNKVRNALNHLLHVPFRFDTLGTQLIYYAEE